MLIDGKTERDLGKIPHVQLLAWARALDRVIPRETRPQDKEALRELSRHLWNTIQSASPRTYAQDQ